MICLILLTILSCQSTNYYEMAGIKNELFGRKEGTSINHMFDSRTFDRAYNTVFEEEMEKSKEKEEEVREMGENELITMVTSIIAGLYAVVKTIINLINKFKKNKK